MHSLQFDGRSLTAIDYGQKNGIPIRTFEPHPRGFIKKSYGDNFKFGRIGSWTH